MTTHVLATVSMQVSFNTEANLARYIQYLDQAQEVGAKLVVFPEESLQGYLQSMSRLTMESLEYQYKSAEVVPDGPSTQRLIREAQQRHMYIVWGMTEADPEQGPDVIYNTAVLVGPEGYIGKYRKIHQPMDELHVFWPGDSWPVFETELGRIGLLICYDKQFPEASRELALRGAQILIMPTAWALSRTGGDPNPDEDFQRFQYDLFDYVRAAENQVYFISSNQYSISGDHDYLGCSRIVAPTGKTLAEVTYAEGMAYASVDIQAGFLQGRTTDSGGLNVFRDRHPETYTAISAPRVPRVRL
jgi:predicted amidohydrolase